MNSAEILEHLRAATNAERLQVIEVATKLIRNDLSADEVRAKEDDQLRAAALAAKHLYEPGGALDLWSGLEGEDFVDDTLPGGNLAGES